MSGWDNSKVGKVTGGHVAAAKATGWTDSAHARGGKGSLASEDVCTWTTYMYVRLPILHVYDVCLSGFMLRLITCIMEG